MNPSPLKLTDNLVCIYCNEDQKEPAKDFIPHIPNSRFDLGEIDTSVHDQQCCACDQMFYLRAYRDDSGEIQVHLANMPEKLYYL